MAEPSYFDKLTLSDIERFMQDLALEHPRGYMNDILKDMTRRSGFRDRSFRDTPFDPDDEEAVQARMDMLRFERMILALGPEQILRFMVQTLAEMGDLTEILSITEVMVEDDLRRKSGYRDRRDRLEPHREYSPTGRSRREVGTVYGDGIYSEGVRFMKGENFSLAEPHSKIKDPNDFRRSAKAPQTPRSARKGR